MTQASVIDAVVIGRNEGDRLVACLASLKGQVRRVIYVDSGSTDGSVANAQAAGAIIVELDQDKPFTAARARNAGFAQTTGADFVQFVDGDCEIVPGWIETAADFLVAHPEYVVACGRRTEVRPDASRYNRFCDQEWNTPVGDALACGGDALMRSSAFETAGGYRDTMIAGEEPELCVRLRKNGGKIRRLDADMTRHDARMTRFGQWWQRSRRAGFAFAEGAALHGARPERHWVKEHQRALIWGAALPLAILLGALFLPQMLWLAFIYPAQIFRLARRMGLEAAVFSVIGKFAEAQGAIDFHLSRLRREPRDIIEYQ